MDNIQQNIQRANLKKKNIARLVLYSELSKYYTMEEIDQMLATISEGGFVDLRSYLKKSEALEDYQQKLVSGENIKTINNQSILGEGNIDIQGGGVEQIQSDWNQLDDTKKDFIKNKPTIPESITIDEDPTEDSPNAVSSGGVYAEMVQEGQNFVNMSKLGAPELNNGRTPSAYSAGDIFSQQIQYDKYIGYGYHVALTSGQEGEPVNDQYKFYYTLSGADAVALALMKKEEGLQAQIDTIIAQLSGVSLTATTSGTLYVGKQATVHITVTTSSEASSIVVKRNGTSIRTGRGTSLVFDDTFTPQASGNITYRVEAEMSGNQKSAEKNISVSEDIINYITWNNYAISPSTVQVGMSATLTKGTVMAVYMSGEQEDVTSSAVFSAHRGSIADHTYIAPSTAGEDTIRASYNGKVADSILTVTIEDMQGPTVEVGHGANYDDAIFTDTTRNLSDNMPVTLDNNAGDYIFIKVGKDETVNNLYIHNEGAGIFEYMEIALDEPQVVGDYKYYKSTNRYNADTAVPYVINKV